MKVLTVRQPWAWLITSGPKDIENRSYNTRHRGPILIQASAKRPSKREWVACVEFCRERGVELPSIDALRYGGIVGSATITDCRTRHDSPWFEGPVGWLLRDRRELTFFPMLGQLSMSMRRRRRSLFTPALRRSPAQLAGMPV